MSMNSCPLNFTIQLRNWRRHWKRLTNVKSTYLLFSQLSTLTCHEISLLLWHNARFASAHIWQALRYIHGPTYISLCLTVDLWSLLHFALLVCLIMGISIMVWLFSFFNPCILSSRIIFVIFCCSEVNRIPHGLQHYLKLESTLSSRSKLMNY